MREADDAALSLDHVRRASALDRPGRQLHGAGERDRKAAMGCDHEQGTASRFVEGVQPRADEPLEAWRDRQRPRRIASGFAGLDAGKLERVERIAPRHLVDARERRPRNGDAQLAPQQPLHFLHAKRADCHAFNRGRVDRRLERCRRSGTDPPGQQESDRLIGEASERELERRGRRRVQPVLVVDRDHQALPATESLQEREDGDAKGPRVDRVVRNLAKQQRRLERAPPRR